MNMHHIASDGWSVGVLAGELAELYRAFTAGRPASLPELPVQYADFAAWQRCWLAGPVLESQLAYWRSRLTGVPPLDLATDRPRPSVSTFRGAVERLEIPAGLLADLDGVSRQHGATLFMTLLAGFQALLGRYAGQDDFGVGTPVANRNRAEVEGLIGFFVNTLVLRADLAGRPTFSELLGRARESALGAYAHQDLPFERLVEELAPQRSLARNPLFQAAFSLHNVPMPALDFGPGLAAAEEKHPVSTAKFDLSLALTEVRGGLEADLEYSSDLFEAATARRLLGHFQALLAAVAADPAARLDEVPLLSAAERLELLDGRNRTAREFPREVPVHRLFESQVRRTPDATAVITAGGERLAYRELNRRANRLAHRLRSLGVGPDVPVVVLLERSVEMLVAILAVLKAGGAYVPLDPRDPAERLSLVLDDVEASVVIGRSGEIVAARLHERGPRALLFIDVYSIEGAQLPSSWESDLRFEMDGENLAYVIYTSGSTGRPKGVAVPHRAVNRLVINTDFVQVGPEDRVAHLSNPAFDAAVFEVWGALLAGAALVVVPREVALSPAALAGTLVEAGVTALFLTTALFNQMAREAPAAFAGVRHLLFGGEAVDPAWVSALLGGSPPQRLLHVYGPTESTTFTTWHEVRDVAEGATVPIGRPLANTRVYVFDRWHAPVPSGVRGELLIGGDGLARGYWNRPDLTAERFVPDPAGAPGARLYRSGDLVRQRLDAAVEFVGRIDHQVKIRGFRIEPGEIEAVLMSHPGVAGALVMPREDAAGDRRLAAYVVPQEVAQGGAPDAGTLRSWLGERLPHYMIPSRFLFLDEFPLNPNGKVDRRALPAPDLSRPDLGSDYVAPRTPLERQVAAAWAEVLGVDRVGVEDSFWELGGHSLLATKVLSRLYDSLGIDLPLQSLFEAPTLGGFAASLAHSVIADSGEQAEQFLEELAAMSEEEVRSLLGEDW
jgi:amino acid adenylation domain-containing protein